MSAKPKSARGDWAKQLRFDMAFAEKTLIARGELTAMFVVHAKDAQHVLVTPWADDEEKRQFRDLVRLWCIAHDAHALTFISEVWLRRMMRHPRETEAEFEARRDAVQPRDAEDRLEAVLVCICWRDDAGERQALFETREITRRDNGKPDGLAPIPSTRGDCDVFGGAMIEVLPTRAPSALEQAAAMALLSRLGVSG